MSNPDDAVYDVLGAADASGVSVATIRRRLNDATLPGAYREGHGPRAAWRIPRKSLVEAGLIEGPKSPETLTAEGYERVIAAKDDQIDALRALVASQEARLSTQGELLAYMERALSPTTTPSRHVGSITEMKKHA